MHWLLALIALFPATWAAQAVATGRVHVSADPDLAIYRDVQPMFFWSITGFYAAFALLLLIFAIAIR